jgi:hypothetical protein
MGGFEMYNTGWKTADEVKTKRKAAIDGYLASPKKEGGHGLTTV